MLLNIAQAAGIAGEAPTIAEILTNILEFLLSIFGILAIISLAAAGMFYFFSAGDEEKMKMGKQGATYAVLGVTIALSGILILKTLVRFLS